MDLLDDSLDEEEFGKNSSNDSSKHSFHINKQFARVFETRERQKELRAARNIELNDEELQSDDDSESDESEDETAEQLSTALDLQIMKTINSIRRRDPKIYDSKTTWFQNNEENDNIGGGDELENENREVEGKKKKKRFKDVLRQQLLASDKGADEITEKKSLLAYDPEQETLREQLLRTLENQSEEMGDGDIGGLLSIKKKSQSELDEENSEFLNEIEEMVQLGQSEKNSQTEIDSDKFLSEYFASKKWTQKDDAEEYDLEREEEELDEEDLFESKYNFRFEELQDKSSSNATKIFGEGNMQVMGHSRQVSDSLRRVNEKRKIEREKRVERKEKEKRQKQEELKRLKNLKKQELKERLKKIGDIGGLKEFGVLKAEDLDDDWDPVKHEELMRKQFNKDYYEQNDDDDRVALSLTSDDVFQDSFIDEFDDGIDEENAYYNNSLEESVQDPQKKTRVASNLLDELYQLDYEDIVGGIPCRFKYRSVDADDYGLTIDDILDAEDFELNNYVSLRKLSPYYYSRHKYKVSNDGADKIPESHKLSKKRKRLRAVIRERKMSEELRPMTEGQKSTKVVISAPTVSDETDEVELENKGKRKVEQLQSTTATEINSEKRKRRRKKKRSQPTE